MCQQNIYSAIEMAKCLEDRIDDSRYEIGIILEVMNMRMKQVFKMPAEDK